MFGQSYFPPINSNNWDSIPPSQLNWNQNYIDSLNLFLDSNNSKAFILLIDGKIVLEKYFNGHAPTTSWFWASAGKSLTAFTLGIAQSENLLNIDDTSSSYLNSGWTSTSPSQESKISIRNQLTMTSGLDDGVNDPNCTVDSCLIYEADPGTRWAYHNGPYTLLGDVLEAATNQNLNNYTYQKVLNPIGMNGLYVKLGFNTVFFSTPRSMARFGHLVLNEGHWDSHVILNDSIYFQEMTNSSQSLNPAYGYLWWLNGKSTFKIPQSQIDFPGSICKDAPSDMYAALGKNGQLLNIVPSKKMVWIRMGDEPGNSLVPFQLNNQIWQYLKLIQNEGLSNPEITFLEKSIQAYPNPVQDILKVKWGENLKSDIKGNYIVSDGLGKRIINGAITSSHFEIDCSHLEKGLYFLTLKTKKKNSTIKFLKG